MKNNAIKNVVANDKEENTMPTIELVEGERTAYIREMEAYLHALKAMPDNEAKQKSHANLVNCKIIQENGEFSEHYKYSRKSAAHKEKEHV